MKGILVLLLVAGISLVFAREATPETIRIEAETIIASHDIGGLVMVIRSCSAASGGLAVDGLDREGEWLQLPLELDHGFCFVDSLRSAAAAGVVRAFDIRFDSISPACLWAEDVVATVPGGGIT